MPHSSSRSHHGYLGRRPSQGYVVAHGFGVHDDVGPSVRLAQCDAHSGDCGPCVSEGHLRSISYHATPFEVFPRVEAGGVHKRHQRQVESIAESHEPGAFPGSGDVDRSGFRSRLVRHHPRQSGRRLKRMRSPGCLPSWRRVPAARRRLPQRGSRRARRSCRWDSPAEC